MIARTTKQLFVLASITVLLLALTGLTQSQKISILWHASKEGLEPAIEDFRSKYPNVEVEIIAPAGELTDSTISMAAGGTLPDVFVNGSAGEALPFVVLGIAENLDDYYARDPEHFQDWSPFILDGVDFFGHRYCVPATNTSTYCLWTNASMFAENALELPSNDWTHDDFVALGKKLARDKDGDGKLDQWIYSWESWYAYKTLFFNHGGSYVDAEDLRSITFSSKSTVDALNWMVDLRFLHGVIPTQAEVPAWQARNAFLQGKVAMTQVGPGWYSTASEGASFDKALLLEPIGPNGRQLMVTHWVWMINSQSENKDLAWELVKCLTAEQMFVDAVMEGSPVFHVTAMQEFWYTDIPVERFTETCMTYFDNPLFQAEPLMPADAAWTLTGTIEEVIAGKKAPLIAVEQAAEKAQIQLDKFYQDFKAK